MTRLIIFLSLFFCSCADQNLADSEIVGRYTYKNGDSLMILNINHDGTHSWYISDKKKTLQRKSGQWESYDLDGPDPRLVIKGFCFPPGVSRANRCTDEYPAIIEQGYFTGNISLPLDIDQSKAALIKTP